MPTYCMTCEMLDSDKERAVGTWYALGMLGCEEEEGTYGVRVRCSFSDKRSLQAAVFDVMRYVLLTPVETCLVEDRDWNAEWRRNVEPVKITDRMWVSPEWREPTLQPGETWIKIEPAMAFGTGHHESTRLVARSLAGRAGLVHGARVLDVGTGSGVLCFAAAAMGASLCVGIDIDPACRNNLVDNRRQNPAHGPMGFVTGSSCVLKTVPCFDIVVMNMILTESVEHLGVGSTVLVQDGILVWSGLLREDRARAISAAGEHGLVLRSESTENEWLCCVLGKVDSGETQTGNRPDLASSN